MLFDEAGTVCDVSWEAHLGQVHLLKYLEYVVNESRQNNANIESKVVQGKKVVDAIRVIVNTKGSSLECTRLLMRACYSQHKCTVVKRWSERRKKNCE